MAIINIQRNVNLSTVLTGSYLNLPITDGISPNGHWYYYTPANANNTSLGATFTPYRWGNALPLTGAVSALPMVGTFALLTESWNSANVTYHGGCIEWIGPGVNDITNEVEDDAFFFAHLGTLSTAPDDDIFYWDRAYDPEAGSDWNYYQYHAHSPTFYPTYENGRQVIGAGGYINPADKAYGYMITTQVRVSGTTYSSILARVHTPSIGGAHNSHNDTTLPTTGNKNYMPGGILKGIGERFHAFYITANGSDWDIYTRTFTVAAQSFGAQTLIGTFNLADPLFNPTLNQQSQYPVRAGCGTTFGSRIYFPVILNNATSGFDLEIWSFNSLDTIAGGSLTRQVIETGVAAKPDCFCAALGSTALYVLCSDIPNGGTNLYKFDGTNWSSQGSFLTNNSANHIRVHGFEFNSEDFRWYALLSGTAAGGGTYLGPGLYSFELDDAFSGYAHLDYDASNNSFVKRGALTTGYVKYTPSLATYTRVNDTEPKAIPADTQVLTYTQPNNQWFNRRSVGFGGNDFYYHSITLQDGRRFACGQITDNEGNRGLPGSGDFLVSIYSSDLSSVVHLAAGTTGDDYLTGCWEDKDNQRIYMSGYCKGAIVPKGDIWLHGWCRNLSDGGSAMEWKDMAVDSEGNVYLIGSHDAGWLVVAKYDRNYELVWQKRMGDNTSFSDIGLGVSVDSNNSVYFCGTTEEVGQGLKDALLFKMDGSGNLLWAKVYGDASNNIGTSVTCILDGSDIRVILSIVTGSDTVFLVTDSSGTVVEQNKVTSLKVNRVRADLGQTTSGRFLFAGNDGISDGRFGMCQLDDPTRMIQWIRGVNTANTVDIKDITTTQSPDINQDNAKYAIVGKDGTVGYVANYNVNDDAGVYTITESWKKQVSSSELRAVICTPLSEAIRTVYAVGTTNASNVATMGMQEGLMTAWNVTDGTNQYKNVFGHDMDEEWVGIAWDYYNRNVLAVGWSESHSDSRDAIFFRYDKFGFGTGVYNNTATGTSPYYYSQTNLATANSTATLDTITAPTDVSGGMTGVTYTPYIEGADYTARDFDGAFGPNGVFTGIIAYLDLDKFQQYQNSEEYKSQASNKNNPLIYVSDPNLIGGFYQFATVGDGSADDGNIFVYDVIKHSNGDVYAIGQTSADVTKLNEGLSGVYDYLIIELNPTTGELEFYQNGTEKDEETYALTELSNGNIAYVGRTTGNIGGVNSGGYDIFLGMFNPNTEISTYHSIGSGLDDVAVNVHDLGSNTAAITYFTYGAVGNNTVNLGSQDIGVIKFNYNTNTWGNAYQIGSTTSEIVEQNGKPSALLSSDRIAIVCSTAGVFADDAITYGFLDVGLGILNFTTGEWQKYQLGTAANEVCSSVSRFGDRLLLGGNAGGSFSNKIDAIFVEFDAQEGLVGLSTSV